MENQKREIGKPLTTDEIRAQAQNWTLAGDVGLLAHLEQFSETILQKTQETQCSMNELVNSFEETSTIVHNVTNQFLAIQNSQFVENRVYDDETPSEEKKLEIKEVDKEAEERLMLSRYKEAVEKGITLLKTHFEEVQLPPSSDSDEEDFSSENGAVIWKPKNPYAGKQFPLLIGSAEWWADDNVGLGEYEENVDSEKVLSESDSDMEADRNIEKRVRMVSSSSSLDSDSGMNKNMKIPESSSAYDDIFNARDDDFESDIFLKKGDNLFGEPESIFGDSKEIPKVSNYIVDSVDATNTFHEKVSKDPLFDNDEDEEVDKQPEQIQPVSAKQKKVENAFTKELAAKLGSVADKHAGSPKIEKSEPVVEPKENKKKPNIFLADDEDNNDDLFFTKPVAATSAPKKSNLFSDVDDDQLFGGSDKLFRDDNSKNFLNDDFSNPVKSSSNHSSQGNSDVNSSKSAVPKKEKLFDGGLFANIDDDDDDTLFSSSTSKKSHPQNSRIFLNEDENSPKVKFSTPFETKSSALDVSDDLFGTISVVDVYDGSSANASDGSLNAARLLEDDSTQDLGFNEQTHDEISRTKSLKVTAEDSPDLFRPQLSSTRRISQETSDYRTQKLLSDQDTDSSNMPHSHDGSKDKMGHNEKSHFSRAQSDVNKSKGFFAEDEDDLFSSNISKQTPSNLFDDNSVSNKKTKDSNIFSGKMHDTLFEDDDNSLFADQPKQPDSVSVSSSRSSLFDEVSVGKSTLSSVFESNKNSKATDDLFKTADSDLFSGDKTDDLFSTVSSKSKNSKENKSLFGDFDDEDDLFSSKTSKSLFSDNDGGEDLFGGSSKNKPKPAERKPDLAAKPEVKAIVKPEFKAEARPEVKAVAKPEVKFAKPEVPGKLRESKIENKETVDDLFSNDNLISKKSEVLKVKVSQDDLFGEIPKKEITPEIMKKSDDLFGEIREISKKEGKTEIKGEKLFDEMGKSDEKSEIKSEKDELFKSEILKDKPGRLETEKSSDDIFSSESVVAKKVDVNITKGTKLFFNDDNTDDLFGSSTKIVKEQPSDEIQKTKNLFNDLEEDDNLFSVKPTKPPAQKSDPSFHDSKGDLFGEVKIEKSNVAKVKEDPLGLLDERDACAPKEEIKSVVKPEKTEKPTPPKSLNIKKNLLLSDEKEKKEDTAAKPPKKVGKLNIPTSLNINPAALLPNANVPKFEKSKEPGPSLDDPKLVPKFEKPKEPEPILDSPVEVSSNLLKCTNKDRVKIQVQRRPQSRRARQEALRSSGIDFGSEDPNPGKTPEKPNSPQKTAETISKKPTIVKIPSVDHPENAAESSGSIFHSVENSPDTLFSSPVPSNPLSPSTDEEDYFNVPELDVNFEKEDQSIFQSNIKNNIKKTDDNLLFDGAPVLSPLSPKKEKIVGSTKSEEKILKSPESEKSDLFSDVFSSGGGSSKIVKKQKIFDDENEADSDEDSLFKNADSNSLSSDKSKKSATAVKTDDPFSENKPFKLSANNEVIKKSLFDEDDSEDLFGGKTVSQIQSSTIPKEIAIAKPAPVKKPSTADKSKESFVDPLGLMSNPD